MTSHTPTSRDCGSRGVTKPPASPTDRRIRSDASPVSHRRGVPNRRRLFTDRRALSTNLVRIIYRLSLISQHSQLYYFIVIRPHRSTS